MNRHDKKLIAEFVAAAMVRARYCRKNGLQAWYAEAVVDARKWSSRFGAVRS
jgi:hypothetical protein